MYQAGAIIQTAENNRYSVQFVYDGKEGIRVQAFDKKTGRLVPVHKTRIRIAGTERVAGSESTPRRLFQIVDLASLRSGNLPGHSQGQS